MLPTITRRSYRPFYMSNLFDGDFFPAFQNRTSSLPAVNIREDEKQYSLELAVPGMDKKDLKIDINRGCTYDLFGNEEGKRRKQERLQEERVQLLDIYKKFLPS